MTKAEKKAKTKEIVRERERECGREERNNAAKLEEGEFVKERRLCQPKKVADQNGADFKPSNSQVEERVGKISGIFSHEIMH